MRRAEFTVRRALGHRLLVLAASATVLFAVTILTALGGYAATVTGDGLRATLATATFDDAGTRITTSVAAHDIPAARRTVTAAVHRVYGHVPAAVAVSARGDSYAVPGQERSPHPQLTTFATYDGIEGHARLVAGRWPTANGIEAALPVPAARAMRLSPGRTVTLHSRVGGPPVTVTVTGLFEARHADDWFWGGDRLVTTGAERLGYTTFGPLVVPPATFSARFATTVTVRWLVSPSTREIRANELTDVAARARALPAALGGSYSVKSSLADLLTQVGRALLVARSTLLIPALQLVVLAVYTLTLVARLLAEHRRVEVMLMRARGASTRQIAGLAASEGLLLALPAAVAAPFLAPPLVRAVAGGTATPPSPVLAWAIAVAGALACAAALCLPALSGVRRTYVAALAERGRGERRAAIQRAGGDLALVVLAALAVWQLAHYGGPVTATATRGLGIDPLIVAGPALALLAGGVLILRLVPVASRAGERATTHGRGLAPAVATRQVSRRPLRTAGPTLLLVMTVAVGVLSVTTGVTWRQSQLDQADFQAGADLRVTAPTDDTSPQTAGQGGRYAALPGVTAVSPVLRAFGGTASSDVTVLAADAAKIARMLRTPFPADPARLAAGRTGAAVPVPGRPSRLSVGVRADRTGGPVELSMILTDAFHVTYEVDIGSVAADGSTHTEDVDLSAAAGAGGAIAYPIAVRGFRFSYVGASGGRPGDLTLTVPALGSPAGVQWTGQITASDGIAENLRPEPGGLLSLRLPPASAAEWQSPQLVGSALVRGGQADAPLPAIVTRDLAARAHVGVGDRLSLDQGGLAHPITVAGIVPALPSVAPGKPGVMVDWAALSDRDLAAGVPAPAPGEWWLTARDTAPAAKALAGQTVVDRNALRRRLRDAPLGRGLRGALILGFGAALVLAAIGFAVHTAVSARERAGEFAILRALGVGGRQVLGLVAVEQAFLVGLGLAGGLLLGVVLARLVVPHVVLTAAATTPYPPVHVILRWPAIVSMLGAIVVLIAAVLLLFARSLRRGRPLEER
ncbi:FtsX-like permease family protein [Actinoallomurus rhizosphaericola]|uniref:FtsX-like permease family protein n=1 Tax=Actinoallomurus rhizosphaericola TaxID=2952536 RepID=UPI002090D355|nr:FtsX-like permease family protein [Actinoallomurus rhizosphaericola]MCO5993181.1 FtsX-like permease family protein [Actinoallomurus rhizosphaericola]